MSVLLVTGGVVVDEDTVEPRDLLVDDGRVVAVLQPGHGRSADHVTDVTGLHVLPGLVDTHVHFNEPGRTEWEGFVCGTTAAAAGGVTTVCDMPLNSHPPTLDARALALKRGAVSEHALVDYALWGGVVPESLDHLAELKRGGVIGVKAFLCDSGLAEYPHLDEFALLEAMQACAELGLLLALHAEDAAETQRRGAEARKQGRNTALDWAHSRPPATEHRAVETALAMARETGAAVHFVHISTATAARLVAAARADGLNVSSETCPHYLVFDEEDLEQLGANAKCAPPLRARAEVEQLWQAVLDGAVDWIASDHSPCPAEMKAPADVWSAWGGISGVQTSLPALLTEGVQRRGLSLSQLTRLTSANPARRVGLYPRKGTLQVGSDADMTIVNLGKEWTLRPDHLETRWPINPFIGRAFRGHVEATLVRGTLVYENGGARVEPGFGQSVHG